MSEAITPKIEVKNAVLMPPMSCSIAESMRVVSSVSVSPDRPVTRPRNVPRMPSDTITPGIISLSCGFPAS